MTNDAPLTSLEAYEKLSGQSASRCIQGLRLSYPAPLNQVIATVHAGFSPLVTLKVEREDETITITLTRDAIAELTKFVKAYDQREADIDRAFRFGDGITDINPFK